LCESLRSTLRSALVFCRRTPRPSSLRFTLAASRPLLSTLPPSAFDRASGAACWTQRGSCARCGCGLAFIVMGCRTESEHRAWVPCGRRRLSGGRRSRQGWHCLPRSFAADHGLTARSTGRAGTRLLLGQHRRGPPVTFVRWASPTLLSCWQQIELSGVIANELSAFVTGRSGVSDGDPEAPLTDPRLSRRTYATALCSITRSCPVAVYSARVRGPCTTASVPSVRRSTATLAFT